ncbi:hypothetical protein RvY_05751-2 [Ramazzottius varieornatus]|uniref:Neurotransmitter-gated ion-channel ligand-binding domain-containing protein n=1 Tax=Ramazzottius varieornatus TaxID=947166 RepID=A0A1D1UW41_RAMVA|nr:hypothetical protein RvY_05751-2 [Ramazzottius varieornatus]
MEIRISSRILSLVLTVVLVIWQMVLAQIILDPSPVTKPLRPRSYIYTAPTLRNVNATRTRAGRPPRQADAADSSNAAPPEADLASLQLTSQNVTDLLNSLFVHYNKTFRPGYAYGPTHVRTSMVVLSLGPISELNSDYSTDCYFRQYWRDERLRFSAGGIQEIALNNLMLDMIWKPDTYFRNGKEYYVHTITTANKLLRLSPNGDITYSMRLTIRAQCPMRLTFYPADMQSCPLIIGSFAYESHDLLYRWDPQGVKIDNALALSQFELLGQPHGNFFAEFDRGVKTENYSMVRVDFQLQRRMGYFLLQIYLPCMLIVVLSWVSFWLNREATERLSLGITAFLTLATMNQDQKDVLPKTSYPTALEWYILICNLYVSASIIQFAAVHFFTKTGFEEINIKTEVTAATDDEWEVEHDGSKMKVSAHAERKGFLQNTNSGSTRLGPDKYGSKNPSSNHRDVKFTMPPNEAFRDESTCQKLIYCITGNEEYRSELIRRGKFRESGINSVSMLDRISRVVFPVSFGLLNVLYWTSFLFAEPPKLVQIGKH